MGKPPVCKRPIAVVSGTLFTLAPEGLPMLQKDDAEHPVPEPLRSTFRQIADAFVAGDYQLRNHPIASVSPVEPETAKWISEASVCGHSALHLFSAPHCP